MARTEASFTAGLESGGSVLTGSEGGHSVVWLVGEHDAFTAAQLSETVARAIADEEGDLVIDLSGVAFMGLATVGVIVRASEFLRGRSRSLAVRSPSTRARRVLELCDVESVIPVAPPPGE